MTAEDLRLVVQTASVAMSAVAVVVALVIATGGRRAAARQARLTFELTSARRLVEVLAQYEDASHVLREGVQGYHDLPALAAALGAARVPRLWHNKFEDRTPPRGVSYTPDMDDLFGTELRFLDEAVTALEALAAEQRASELGWWQRRRRR